MKKIFAGLVVLLASFGASAQAIRTYTTMYAPVGGPYHYTPITIPQSGNTYNPTLASSQQVLDADVLALLADGWTTINPAAGGGSSAFNAITSGTNTTAAMQVGSGAMIGPTASSPGTVNANEVNGAGVPASQACLGSNGSSQLITGTCSGSSGTTVVTCTGSGDDTNINTALSGGGHVVVKGTCVLSNHLTVPSNTWADFGTSTVTYSPASGDYLLGNTQAQLGNGSQTAAATATGCSITAGSASLTCSGGHTFTAADVGQSIKVPGAYGSGAYLWYDSSPTATITDLHTSIATVVSGTNVILADTAGATVSATSDPIYTRDSNIALTGGKFFFGGPNAAAGGGPIIEFETVNNLTISGVQTNSGTSYGVTSTSGNYNFQLADATNVLVDNITVSGWSNNQDGIHLTGPLRATTVRHIRGSSGDDFVAIIPINGCNSETGILCNVYGVVSGLLIDDIEGSSRTEHGVRFGGASGNPMILTDHVTVRHVVGQPAGSTSAAATGFSEAVQLDAGYYGDILVQDVSGAVSNAGDLVNVSPGGCSGANVLAISFRSLTLKDIGNATTANTGPLINVNGYTVPCDVSIGSLTIDGVRVNGSLLGSNLLAIDGSTYYGVTTVDKLALLNVSYTNITDNVPVVNIFGNVTDFIARNVQLEYNLTGNYTGTNGIFNFAGGTDPRISLSGVHVTYLSNFSGGVGLLAFNNASGHEVTSGDVHMNDISIEGATSAITQYVLFGDVSTNPLTYTLDNVRVDNISGCAYVNGYPLAAGLGQITNVYATNLPAGATNAATCQAASNGVPTMPYVTNAGVGGASSGVGLPLILSNQSATIGTTTLYTAPSTVTNKTLLQLACTAETHTTATGAETLTIYALWDSTANYGAPSTGAAAVTLNLQNATNTANSSISNVWTIPAVSSGKTLAYQFSLSASNGGSYDAWCQLLQFN
jgi:hypothetical protein